MLDHFLAAHRANEGPVEIQDRKTRKRVHVFKNFQV